MTKTETKKRARPNFAGVAGELLPQAPEGLVFGRMKASPYDALLDQLAAAPRAAALKFGDVKARSSVALRAKKKGLRVSFNASTGVLYVRFDGRVDDDVRQDRRDKIRGLLGKLGPLTSIKMANRLRENGDATIDAATAETILLQMMRAGDLVRQEGGAFGLAPGKKATA
jgi:hypothetical protein